MIARGFLLVTTLGTLHSATAAAATPMAYLRTVGPAGDPATRLGWFLGIVSIVVVLVIGGLVLGAVFHRRAPRPFNERALAVDREGGGMAWIQVGAGVTAVVLAIAMGWTLVTTARVVRVPSATALTVQVTASQWWWALRYMTEQPQRTFTTANEIHIPVGQPVRFELASTDVIHSFWIPKLGGKTDVIPGQTNVTWLEANTPGVYRGQCAMFCGTSHAWMALQVVAQAPADFRRWQEHQISEAPAPATPALLAGQHEFQTHCAACHTVRGSDAAGVIGPDLTHLMSRDTLAAGTLPNTPGNLAGWVANPQRIKPGAQMPDGLVSGGQLASVLAYLNTLN